MIDDFVAEHAAGRTPNPCARCNGEIKFGAFLRRADELGVDLVATGHYVRTARTATTAGHLRRGVDRAKDQTYMLHMLGQSQLRRSLFPVGGLPKTETRALAERFGLPVATKPDSQELCFAPSGDAGAFVRSRHPSWCTPAARSWRRRRVACSPSTTERSRSRSGSGGVWAWRWVRPPTSSTSTPRRTAWWWGRESLLVAARAGRGPRLVGRRRSAVAIGPFEAEVRIRYRGEDAPAVVTPTAGGFRVEFARAAARGRAGPERGDLPRRRAPGRRAHRRVATLNLDEEDEP